jgi:NAD(P)-dependent dehydrogenase (short-subunit alcohol dehydrogenase family)
MNVTDCFDVKNKVVVVTGGLGLLGREFVKEFLRRGARPVVLDQDISQARIKDAGLESVFCVSADVTQSDSLQSALAAICAKYGSPDILINNAAIDAPPSAPAAENGPFETYPEASWDRIMDVNVKGVFLCCQIFGGAMATGKGGSIINISSIYGMLSPVQSLYEYRAAEGNPFTKPVTYSVSKSAILNLTRYLATYWAKQNVRVNTLTLAGVFNQQDPRFLKGYCERMPVGRMAEATEYNGAIVFLASDASRYMTGSNLVVDGGWTAW